MKKSQSHCCSCAVPAYPCIPRYCPYASDQSTYCDLCGFETNVLFFGGRDVCFDCLVEEIGFSENDGICSECGEEFPLCELDGELICRVCLSFKFK